MGPGTCDPPLLLTGTSVSLHSSRVSGDVCSEDKRAVHWVPMLWLGQIWSLRGESQLPKEQE